MPYISTEHPNFAWLHDIKSFGKAAADLQSFLEKLIEEKHYLPE